MKRGLPVFYKQTILGPLWAIIQPLLTTVVFTIIFGNLAKLTTADVPGNYVIPGFLFYMAGNKNYHGNLEKRESLPSLHPCFGGRSGQGRERGMMTIP